MTPDAVERYKNGASIERLARENGMNKETLRGKLVEAGVEIRPGGRPPTPTNVQQGHRGPKFENVPLIVPRYSCGHRRTKGYTQCPTCDRCSCTEKRRRPVRKYGGLWLCRCGRQIEP